MRWLKFLLYCGVVGVGIPEILIDEGDLRQLSMSTPDITNNRRITDSRKGHHQIGDYADRCYPATKRSRIPVYYINRDDQKDRRAFMEKTLTKMGLPFRRISAIVPNSSEYNLLMLEKPCKRNTPTDIAVILSHLKAIYSAIYDSSTDMNSDKSTSRQQIRKKRKKDMMNNYALIMEDDAKPLYDIDFQALINSTPLWQFGTLQLVTSHSEAISLLWRNYLEQRRRYQCLWRLEAANRTTSGNTATETKRTGKTAAAGMASVTQRIYHDLNMNQDTTTTTTSNSIIPPAAALPPAVDCTSNSLSLLPTTSKIDLEDVDWRRGFLAYAQEYILGNIATFPFQEDPNDPLSARHQRLKHGALYWKLHRWDDFTKNRKTNLYWSAQAYIINKAVVKKFIDDVIEVEDGAKSEQLLDLSLQNTTVTAGTNGQEGTGQREGGGQSGRSEDNNKSSNAKTSESHITSNVPINTRKEPHRLRFKIVNSFIEHTCPRKKERPCVTASCLFADSYIFAGAGPTYTSLIPLFIGAKVGLNSTLQRDRVGFHRKGFSLIHAITEDLRKAETAPDDDGYRTVQLVANGESIYNGVRFQLPHYLKFRNCT